MSKRPDDRSPYGFGSRGAEDTFVGGCVLDAKALLGGDIWANLRVPQAKFGHRPNELHKAVTMRGTGTKPFGMEPTFFVLMFSKRVGGRNQYFTVYIELRDEDKALLEGTLSDALKARLLVERVGILELLPEGLNDDWPNYWTVIEHKIDSFWHMGIQPTKVKRHNIWIVSAP